MKDLKRKVGCNHEGSCITLPDGDYYCSKCGFCSLCNRSNKTEKEIKADERRKTLEEVEYWVLQNKQMLEMFNPMSEVVRSRWNGEMGVYKKLLKWLSKLKV